VVYPTVAGEAIPPEFLHTGPSRREQTYPCDYDPPHVPTPMGP